MTFIHAITCTLALMFAMASPLTAAETELLAHWPLTHDARDHSGNDHHGIVHGVEFGAVPDGQSIKAARFDGVDDSIKIPSRPSLQFGSSDFSISARVYTDDVLADSLGDLVSSFDPDARKGFQLGILHHAGMTTSQTNYRNLFFGIDDDVIDQHWQDCGRPGQAVFICSLAVHKGDLFAGTFEIGEGEYGHVFRYAGGDQWEDCGSPDDSNSVMSLAVFNGHLYAGTGRYNSRGSALAAPGNTNMGGRVFRYAGKTKWIDCGKPSQIAVTGLTVFRGRLYASSMYDTAVFCYADGTKWQRVGDKQRVFALAPFNGSLYAATSGRDDIYRYTPDGSWLSVGNAPRVTQYYSFAVYQSQLHVGTWPESIVYRFDGTKAWRGIGRPGAELESMALGVYNGKLYTGTLPNGEVFRFDGEQRWTSVGRVDSTPDVKYRRAWTMAVFQGKLFCGTLPSGHVLSLEAGKVVTDDQSLSAGWRHVVAVRRSDALLLYVDGQLRGRSSGIKPEQFNLSTNQPLRIGVGEQDHFHGALKNVRVYKGALSDADIAKLFHDGD